MKLFPQAIGTLCLILGLIANTKSANSTQEETKKIDRKAVESIIREYILNNPSIVEQALENLGKQKEQAKRLSQRKALKENIKELFHDSLDPIGGNPSGDITVVSFFDYNCGYCKITTPVLNALIARDKKVRVVFKEFPILGPDSVTAAKAALAARKHVNYLDFHNALMKSRRVKLRNVIEIANKLGINGEKLKQEMQNPALDQIIKRNHILAQRLGINGTPAFVVGEKLIGGAVDLEHLVMVIEEQRKMMKNRKQK